MLLLDEILEDKLDCPMLDSPNPKEEEGMLDGISLVVELDDKTVISILDEQDKDNLPRLEESISDDENSLLLLDVSDELGTGDVLELEDNLPMLEEPISDDENMSMLLDVFDELGT